MAERGAPQSFHLTAGESFVLAFEADGEITGSTVRFWAARTKGGTPVLSTEDSPATAIGAVTTSPAFTVTVSDEDTESLVSTYHYEVELEDTFGNKSKAAHGYLTFEKALA
jgi:hypothetical protein